MFYCSIVFFCFTLLQEYFSSCRFCFIKNPFILGIITASHTNHPDSYRDQNAIFLLQIFIRIPLKSHHTNHINPH